MFCITAPGGLVRPASPILSLAGKQDTHLEKTDRLAHRALDVQRLDVLPVLLEQRDQEVDSYKNPRSIGRPHFTFNLSESQRTQHDVS